MSKRNSFYEYPLKRPKSCETVPLIARIQTIRLKLLETNKGLNETKSETTQSPLATYEIIRVESR
jgi:hypothetical protein